MTKSLDALKNSKGHHLYGRDLAQCVCGEIYPLHVMEPGALIEGGETYYTADDEPIDEYEDSTCPYCHSTDVKPCRDLATAWNFQQSRIDSLIAALEQAQQREQEWKAICEAAAIDLDEWTELDKKSGDLICKLADAFIKQGERIAELELSCDRNYINGMKTGWNYCDAGNSEGFEKCIEQRRKAMESLCVNPDVTMRGVEPLCVKLQPELWEITIPGELAHSHAYHSPENGDYSPDQVVERFYSESQLRAAGVTVGGE